MSTETFTLYKLIILYMLSKVTFPLTNGQISNFILDKEYTNYFTLQQVLSELVESELIRQDSIRNTSHYSLTKDGENTLEYFGSKISDAIKKDIDSFLEENKYQLRNEVSTLADFFQTSNQDYLVRCQVKEKDSILIELNLAVPSKEQANIICNNWESKSQEIYSYTIKTLMN